MNSKVNLLMPEAETINEKNLPVTRDCLKTDFSNIGIKPGMTLIVHSSLKSIGWVCGREITVVDALMEVLTPEGTLVMPTHSSDYSDPSAWMSPPVPSGWVEIIKAEMPVFRPEVTPSRK